MGSITNALFGKGGSGTAGEAINVARDFAQKGQFRPYTVTTSTGRTAYDPATGGYTTTLSSPLQSLLTQATTGAGSLFGQVADFDPNVRAADIFSEQAALLQPEFERQATDLQSRLFGSGRLGLRLAGESQGLGTGSGMVQPDALGLGRSQQQVLAQLAPMARQQAYGEQASMIDMAGSMLGAGLQLGQVENNLMSLGLSAEQARAAAALGAGNLAVAPYTTKAKLEEDRRSANAGFFGALAGAAGTAAKAGAFTSSDVRLKENINHVDTLPNGIKLYTWDWKEDRNAPTFGVLAQEIQQLIPEAVVQDSSGYLMVDYSHPELKGVH